eukprot:SAG31_NODE_1702_length_7496_cov_2.367311_5_plen_162_part_00
MLQLFGLELEAVLEAAAASTELFNLPLQLGALLPRPVAQAVRLVLHVELADSDRLGESPTIGHGCHRSRRRGSRQARAALLRTARAGGRTADGPQSSWTAIKLDRNQAGPQSSWTQSSWTAIKLDRNLESWTAIKLDLAGPQLQAGPHRRVRAASCSMMQD